MAPARLTAWWLLAALAPAHALIQPGGACARWIGRQPSAAATSTRGAWCPQLRSKIQSPPYPAFGSVSKLVLVPRPARAATLLAAFRSPSIHAASVVGAFADKELDPDFMDSLNDVCSRVIRVCSAGDESQAAPLVSELSELEGYLEAHADPATAYFVVQLRALLEHRLPQAGSQELQGPYLKAYNRVVAALVGTTWRIGNAKTQSDGAQQQSGSSGPEDASSSGGGSSGSSSSGSSGSGIMGGDYYQRLGVGRDATAAEVKRAYRTLAMKYHPDVSDHPDAHDLFSALSSAYDVLSDDSARKIYNIYGEKGLASNYGGSGRRNSDAVWDELEEWVRANRKPAKPNKRARAREVAGKVDRDAKWEGWDGVPERLRSGVAQFGDVVIYPLSETVKDNLQDGRDFGIGVVVGRNIDRGDVAKIPTELLELCEVEPLEYVDGRWRADPTSVGAYPKLTDLQAVEVEAHIAGGVGEVGGWFTLVDDHTDLSPVYHDEIML